MIVLAGENECVVSPPALWIESKGHATAMARRISSGILRASMLTMSTQEEGPSSNWAFLSPSIWGISEESIGSQLRVVASSPLEARMAACVLLVLTPHLKWKPSG